MAIWDSVVASIKTVSPRVRFFTVTAPDQSGKFDENAIPKGLSFYGKWFPMVIFVPGPVWDAAMSQLGPQNKVEIKEGVQVFNGAWDKGDFRYAQKYDVRRPEEFSRWVKDSLADAGFQAAQNRRPAPTPIVTAPSAIPVASHQASAPTCGMRIISRPY
jgi:hypothetical protein